MITMTCLILWMPTGAAAGLACVPAGHGGLYQLDVSLHGCPHCRGGGDAARRQRKPSLQRCENAVLRPWSCQLALEMAHLDREKRRIRARQANEGVDRLIRQFGEEHPVSRA